jgi:hypothetical protein
MAAQKMNDRPKALSYYRQLLAITGSKSNRPEIEMTRAYLSKGIILNVSPGK